MCCIIHLIVLEVAIKKSFAGQFSTFILFRMIHLPQNIGTVVKYIGYILLFLS